MSAIDRQTLRGAGRRTRATLVVLLALLVVLAAWIGIRAYMARDALLGAVPIANRIGSQVLSDGADIDADLSELQSRASSAAALTSDPVWRAAEIVPFLGANLTAFREAAGVIDALASKALPPVSDLAGSFSTRSLAPVNGAVDLQAFEDAQPALGEARDALKIANRTAIEIDTASTIPQIGSAVDQIVELVTRSKTVIDSLSTAATLLPTMLGGDEARSYLLLSLNNAELRATGGLPGAIAVINADNGAVTLGVTSSATALGNFDEPVLALTDAESTLYGEALGTWMHDVNFTPDFARSGELARSMWQARMGQTVDGVLSIDPIALGYLLGATGPITLESGVVLTSENAARILLSDVYATFAAPKQQDEFFEEATGKVFAAMTSGKADGPSLIRALGKAAGENRIHVWSGRPQEQTLLKTTAIAGEVPVSTADSTAFGVYLNDATGAKMDYYVNGAIAIASGVCRNDQRPNFEVRVSLSSSAPADAATALPPYVTGGGTYGVAPGNVRTNLFVYAPSGSVPYSVTIDGQEYAFVEANHNEHSVAGVTVELSPGQSSTVSMKFVGLAGSAETVALQHTPMATAVETSLDNYLDCAGIVPAPTEDDAEQTEALVAYDNEDSLRRDRSE
jgi:hypothetical protein